MAAHPQREQAIRRCLEQGQAAAAVAAELGVATSTLRGWLRRERLERELAALRQQLEAVAQERDVQRERQREIEVEMRLAAAQLAALKRLLDAQDPPGGPAAGRAAR
jgi:transposase-like protein